MGEWHMVSNGGVRLHLDFWSKGPNWWGKTINNQAFLPSLPPILCHTKEGRERKWGKEKRKKEKWQKSKWEAKSR